MKSLLIALSLALIALCGGSQMLPYVQSQHYVDVLEMHEDKRKASSMSPHLGLSNSGTDALYQAYLSYAPLVYKVPLARASSARGMAVFIPATVPVVATRRFSVYDAIGVPDQSDNGGSQGAVTIHL